MVRSATVARKANKVSGKDPVRVNYFLPAEVVARIDRFATDAKKHDPLGRETTRTDAIKALIVRALDLAGIK